MTGSWEGQCSMTWMQNFINVEHCRSFAELWLKIPVAQWCTHGVEASRTRAPASAKVICRSCPSKSAASRVEKMRIEGWFASTPSVSTFKKCWKFRQSSTLNSIKYLSLANLTVASTAHLCVAEHGVPSTFLPVSFSLVYMTEKKPYTPQAKRLKTNSKTAVLAARPPESF